MEVIEVIEKEIEVIEVIERGPQGPQGAGITTLTTQGDLLYRGATTGERLPIGTTGQILKVSSGGIPEWGAAPSSGVSSVSGTSPIVSSGGSTPAISITAATTSAAGSMSAADKTKLDGIASGAEVNVNADWNASSGDAQILNKPTIPSTAADVGAVPTSRTISAGTGLTGGGDLSANRTLSVSFGTTAGTACEGNDGRIAGIESGSTTVNAATVSVENAGISIDTADGTGELHTGDGGSISTNDGGGSIDTSEGGGSINTRGTGSIEFGIAGTRTTLTGTATADRAISLPNAAGTLALTQQAADYEVTNATKGVIMKSPNGSRWRLTIDDNGSLIRAMLTLLLSLFFMCGAQAQVRDLVYGTNNVVIGPTNTNALSFTNSVAFSNPLTFGTNATTTRTNLGLGTLATNNTVPSGAAASNSLLTADGAGGSVFVASKTVTVVKSADQSKTNDANLTITNNNDPELTQTVTAGSIYRIDVRLEITTGTNSGFNAGIFTGATNVFSSTSQTVGTAMRHNLNSTTFYVSTAVPAAQITFGGTGVTSVANNGSWTATGVFRCATNGTLTVRWAQNVASNSATTLHAGSSFSLTKLN